MAELSLGKARRICVLCGGDSPEREVSLRSGTAIHDTLSKFGNVEKIDLKTNRLSDDLDPARDVIFPIIHGVYGEDGRLQAELEGKGFVYAGSDYSSSVVAFDKFYTKAIAERAGLKTVPDLLIKNQSEISCKDLSLLGNKFIFKPRRQGSSIGMFIGERSQVGNSIPLDAEECYLIESYIEGVDITIGILGDQVMAPVAIRPVGGFYDYDHKYTKGKTHYEVPAKLDSLIETQLKQWALRVFELCDCRDFARVDFRLADTGQLYFLEINTLPGMTETSLLPKSASVLGINFDNLVLKMIEPAIKRFNERA